MLTLGELLKLSAPKVVRLAGRYRADYFRVIEPDQSNKTKRIVGIISGGDKPRKTMIEVTDPKASTSSRALVYCSCPFFIHNLEIALAARGSAKILNAKVAMPNKTNQKFQPGLCPHLVFLAKLALSAESTQKRAEQKTVKIDKRLKTTTAKKAGTGGTEE